MECEVCGAPAEYDPDYTCVQEGVDFDGQDAFFTLLRVVCVAGHWYTTIGGSLK